MSKFDKPGTKEGDYPEWVLEAGSKALADAAIAYEDVQQAFAGYCYGDSTYGQRAIYGLGLTGIPVVNVNNNCSTGSSALFWHAKRSRAASWTARSRGRLREDGARLAGDEVHRPHAGDGQAHGADVRDPLAGGVSFAPQMFGNAARDHIEKYGSTPDHYAWIGWKNHKHSVNNPYAQFQHEHSIEDIKAGKVIHEPLTKRSARPHPTAPRRRSSQASGLSTSTISGLRQ